MNKHIIIQKAQFKRTVIKIVTDICSHLSVTDDRRKHN